VGSDELHYNLHILIRFEIESDIVLGNMTVEEMPDVWNDKYESYFGTRPKNDTEGCLQDVHWVRGAVGYFPTYSYGNLIGAQIWDCLTKDITNTTDQMERGDFSEILDWLSSKIYQQGMLLNPKDLVEQVTGKPMQVDSWNQYARQKFSAMYGV
jgi:carboxypeptidase Taq